MSQIFKNLKLHYDRINTLAPGGMTWDEVLSEVEELKAEKNGELVRNMLTHLSAAELADLRGEILAERTASSTTSSTAPPVPQKPSAPSSKKAR